MASRGEAKRSDEGPLFDSSVQTIKKGGQAKIRKQKAHQKRDDLMMEEHLIEEFRAMIGRCLVDLRKEELSLTFAKVEEGSQPP